MIVFLLLLASLAYGEKILVVNESAIYTSDKPGVKVGNKYYYLVNDTDENLIDNTEIEIAQWNLDRVDYQGRDGVFSFETSEWNGTGVDLYILDTGIRIDHEAFQGRDIVLPPFDSDDCNSHGTHVASTAAGFKYGIAHGATIIPVKVLDCDGKGSVMSLAQGISWTCDSIKERKKIGVVNLSIQAGGNDVIDEMVNELYHCGAIVVVAAANFNSDACNYSPARAANVITVGATTKDDSKLSSSNYGKCVDLYAPGDEIIGAGIASRTATLTKRGTSMATPLVSGIAATLIHRFPSYDKDQIIDYLLASTSIIERTGYDCASSLEGQRMARTLYTDPPNQLTTNEDDIIYWKNDLCNGSFHVKGSNYRIAVSTVPFPNGLDTECIDQTVQWYVIDSKINQRLRVFDNHGSVIYGDVVTNKPVTDIQVRQDEVLIADIPVLSSGGMYVGFGGKSVTYTQLSSCYTPPTYTTVITKKQRGYFFKWVPIRSCTEFLVQPKTKLMIGLKSNKPMKRIRQWKGTLKLTRQAIWHYPRQKKKLILENKRVKFIFIKNKGIFLNNKLLMSDNQQGNWIGFASTGLNTFFEIRECTPLTN